MIDEKVILGVDPSLRGTGYAVVRVKGAKRWICEEYGVIRVASEIPVEYCLLRIHETLMELIARCNPAVLAIESTIYVQSVRTAIVLGAARGAALLAAARSGMEIHEFAPRKIKQAVVGRGAAKKEQVAFMVRSIYGLTSTPPSDAADALAVATAYLQGRAARKLYWEKNEAAQNPVSWQNPV